MSTATLILPTTNSQQPTANSQQPKYKQMKHCHIYCIMLAALLLAACSDPWEERLDQELLPTQSVWEIISSHSDYSGFRDLLIETGYDSILQRNTVFTVLVPIGQTLPGVAGMGAAQKSELAASHLSNSILYSKDITDGTTLKSLSGKNMNFELTGNTFRINRDVSVIKSDVLAVNGVIHEINGPQVIRPNLLDYINSHQTFSHIADYFNENTDLIFDQVNSVPIGINDFGQTIYDTIWRKSNPFFTEQADLTAEDKQFTIFLANNILLDTADFGELKPGYLSGIGGFILEGFYDENELTSAIIATNGKRLNLPEMNFKSLARASNGMIYELLGFAGVPIPKTFIWEITAIADFDSIRFVRQVNYASMLDRLKDIRVYDVEGGFTAFSYAFDPRAKNTDYLRIQTSAGTYASIDINMPNMAPGEYSLTMNAMIRVNDGLTFDVYFNNEKIKTGVTLNGGSFAFEDFDLGIFTATEDSGNILTLKISGANTAQRSGFIDYLLFVPVK